MQEDEKNDRLQNFSRRQISGKAEKQNREKMTKERTKKEILPKGERICTF